jgi:hypothetical protein
MDFATSISNSEKRSLLDQAIADVESQIRRLSWTVGIDPDDLSASYTAPAVTPADDYALEHKLEDVCARRVSLKTERDAIPS